MNHFEYAGFWIRTLASLIDTVLLLLIIVPVLTLIYGPTILMGEPGIGTFWYLIFNYVFPAAVIILFWYFKSATPGKMVLKLVILDAETGGKPATWQLVVRYLGYYVSTIPLLFGLIWVGLDKRKQGWHDKLAGTIVIKPPATVATSAADSEINPNMSGR